MRIILGIGSGLLLALALPPFSTPLFSFFIFTPLIFLVASKRTLTRKSLFINGFLAGAIGGGSLAFCIFHTFAWPSDAPLVLILIQWSPILWGVLFGCTLGGGLVLYRKLRFASPLLNAALGASLYVLFEQSLQFITGHYYVGALAYTVTFFKLPFMFASIGGELLVSFAVALVGMFLGELLALEAARRLHVLGQCAAVCAVIALICLVNEQYLKNTAVSPLRVAIIQGGNRDSLTYANDYQGTLSSPSLAAKLQDAAQDGNLIIYPSAVINKVLYTDAPPAQNYGDLGFLPRTTLEAWMARYAPSSSTVVTWDITYDNGKYLQNYDFWNGGILASSYSKRRLYAFTEYTPTFAHFGFGPTPAPISPGTSNGLTETAGNITVGNLQCSEVHLSSLARGDSSEAQILLAIGLEWIFPADMGEIYSLGATQYRAAENNIPAVRATAEGPSALIDARGTIVERLGFNEESILRGTLSISARHRPTLYSIVGDYPLYIGVTALLIVAFRRRKNY